MKNITIHDIIDYLNSDPAGVSIKFGIPLSTVYSWCNSSRKPPVYVLDMMKYIIALEKYIEFDKEGYNGNEEEGLEVRMGSNSKGKQEAGQES